MADLQIFKGIFPQIEELAKFLMSVNTILFYLWKDKHTFQGVKICLGEKLKDMKSSQQWLINKSLCDVGVGLLFEAGLREGVKIRGSSVRVLVVAIELHPLAVVVVVVGGIGAVLVVVNLAGQAVGAHALLRGHFVGAHLQRDGGCVTVFQLQLLVKDVPPGSWGRHASLAGSLVGAHL